MVRDLAELAGDILFSISGEPIIVVLVVDGPVLLLVRAHRGCSELVAQGSSLTR